MAHSNDDKAIQHNHAITQAQTHTIGHKHTQSHKESCTTISLTYSRMARAAALQPCQVTQHTTTSKKSGHTHTQNPRTHTHTFAHTRARRRPRVAFLSCCWLAADSLSPEAKQRAERPRHAAPDCGEPLRPPNGSSALSVAVLRLIIVLLCDKAGYLSGNGLKNGTNIKPFGGVPGFGWHDLQRM